MKKQSNNQLKSQNKNQEKSENFVFRLLGCIIVVLVISIIGFYVFPKNSINIVVNKSQPSAAIFISKLAPATVSLLGNYDDFQKSTKIAEFSQIKKLIFPENNIDYLQDIQSWLNDEITLSITNIDLDRNPENGLQPGYLMAISTAKVDRSREFLELLFSQRALSGTNLEIAHYKGIKVIYDTPETSLPVKIKKPLAGAVVNDFLLLANDVRVIKEAINNLQVSDLNLASYLAYQKSIKELPENALAIAFFNLPNLAKLQGLEYHGNYDHELLSLVINNQSLLAESTFVRNTKKVNITSASLANSSSSAILKYIPETAKLVIKSSNLSNLGKSDISQLSQELITSIYGDKENITASFLPSLQKIQTALQVNFDQDIFPAISGEYAIALLPNSWIFVVEKNPQLSLGITRLNEIANDLGLNVNSLNLGQQKISVWDELTATNNQDESTNVNTNIRGLHTTIDNYEIFTSDLKTLQKITSQVTSKDKKTLLENQEFIKSMKMLPASNQGYIYIDWQKSQDILEQELPILKFLEVLGKPLFENLRSFTISSYSSTPEILKGGLLFHFND
ncbi:DUF3352 domain-containing protein [Anabaena sp. FACHB-1237]|uniref:DUF3352 domain-containing protein n=1 Tax=Anabaena sp. FACHB-1237 TaxID=2692769 RepID=UPI00168034B3|nr:DUF3352 domain-containing protein [Anabaena sp. FACHB-1237]MBD2137785.1 DUF3352 domain-containing protein [Anabaena sp. FACHB-1237]